MNLSRFVRHYAGGLCAGALVVALAFLAFSCGGSSSPMNTNAMGTVNVSISDPPSCKVPSGSFTHVYVSIRSVQAHTSTSADDNTPGWQELAPQLAAAPQEIDLFAAPQANCILALLGSAQLPVGNYQQIRLLLVSNSPAASDAVPKENHCAGHGFNCVVLEDTSIHQLDLSSQANTGLKIPPGQVLNGPIQVQAGQSIDLNIDFNVCASILQEGGQYRLKPTLTASQVSTNNSGISGQIVDSVTKLPIKGDVFVAIEKADSTGTDRVVMATAADSNGNFRICPLPLGPFDIVAVAVGPANLPYNATAVLNVPNGTSLGTIPLIAETGATAPATLQGFVTATNAGAPAQIDVSLSALQVITLSGGAMRGLTIPLETIKATASTPEVDSTGLISVKASTTCPTGSPANSNCAQYTLVVPASNPNVGVFASGAVTFTAPASGDVLFTVDAIAAKPMSGGTLSCTPSELTTSKDANAMPLKVTPATITNVARLDFSGCS